MCRKYDSRVFIFGAGVSKAVAGAPVMKELFSRMRERYKHEKIRTDILGNRNNRVSWFERIVAFIDELERRAKRRFGQITENEGVKIRSDIRENIEYLITLLDIHTEYGAMFRFEQPGADWNPYPFIPLDDISREEIDEVRSCLNTYQSL